jgi:predicted phage tail protein
VTKFLIPTVAALLVASLASNVATAMGRFDKDDRLNSHSAEQSNSSKAQSHIISTVPELAVGAIGGAFVIIAGASLIALGRRRTKQS